MKSGKRHITEGMELAKKKKIWKHEEKDKYKYLGILKTGTIKQAEMKEKIKKEYLRRRKNKLET